MPSALSLALGDYASENGKARKCYQHERASTNQRRNRFMASKIISAARVRELLNYNQETGVFTRRVRTSNRIKTGEDAGGLNSNGYVRISLDGQKHLAHRLAWIHVHGALPPNDIDHINGNRSDNRLSNLRGVTHAENHQNRHSPNKGSTSKYLGVSWYKAYQKWMSRITLNGRSIFLGYFETEEAAAAAYITAKHEHHPFATTKETPCLLR